jgi:glycosyltransferase involved in cell wall biosynthesis
MESVAVILPVYNEAWLIGSVFSKVADHAKTHPNWTYRFVDDGSNDGTAEEIRQRVSAKGAAANIELIRRNPNSGKAMVIHDAMLGAEEDLILFTDGDLAYPLEHLDQLVVKLGEADVVIGSRALVEAPQTNIRLGRRAMGGSFNMLVRLLTGLPHHDTQAGLKGFRRTPAQAIFRRQRVWNFAFDAELLFLAHRLGLRVAEIPAKVSSRHSYKKSKMNLLKDPPRMLWSLLRMRISHRGARWNNEVHIEPDPETKIEVFPEARTRITAPARSVQENVGVGS